MNLRGTSSSPAPSKGIDIWTSEPMAVFGQPPSFQVQDVFRVMKFTQSGSNFTFPQQVFKIDGNGNVDGGSYSMKTHNFFSIGNPVSTHTLINQNSLQWKVLTESTYGLLQFAANRRLGLNTTTPNTTLHINTDNVSNEGEGGQVHGLLIENNGWRDHDHALEIRSAHGKIFSVSNSATVHIGEGLNWAIPYYESGRFRLYVQDGIRTERIRVDIAAENGWADYVFDEDYVLMPIDELEAFIKKNKHLPNVPSEAQVKAEGIDLAEMNAILLRQIEELTLRIIELEKAK